MLLNLHYLPLVSITTAVIIFMVRSSTMSKKKKRQHSLTLAIGNDRVEIFTIKEQFDMVDMIVEREREEQDRC